MFKKLILYASIAAVAAMAACNSSSSGDVEYELSKSVEVTGFSLTDDTNVLDSLKNVFFSIDLVNAQIYNADSLPFGTKVDRLIPVINTPSNASAVTLEFPRPGRTDSIVNFLTNSTDSIDFSNGPVKLRVVSQSGTVERVYQVRVNVHQVKPDTLAWKQIESAPLPSAFASIDTQGAAAFAGKYYLLTSSAQKYCLAATDNPADPKWDVKEIEFPFAPRIETLRAGADAMYMLADNGDLHYTADFASWTAAGQSWHSIYGQYGSQIIGCKQQADGSWFIASYPDGKTWPMPQGFPVAGASLPATYSTDMGFEPQLVMAGGRDSEGKAVSSSWGFDGNTWTNVSLTPLPQGLEGLAIVPYYTFTVPSTTWSPVKDSVLLAFGGRNQAGEVNGTVYMSYDWGLTWKEAPQLMQLPADVPKVYDASAFVHATLMHTARSSQGWSEIATRALYPQCRWIGAGASRVEKPVTEWECPAIYVFGGRTADGKAVNSVWRGQILRFSFVPVY